MPRSQESRCAPSSTISSGFSAAADLGDDVATACQGPPTLFWRSSVTRSAPRRPRAAAPGAGRPRGATCAIGIGAIEPPGDRVPVEQVARPRRHEEDRRRAVRRRPPASSRGPRGTRRRGRRRSSSGLVRTSAIAPARLRAEPLEVGRRAGAGVHERRGQRRRASTGRGRRRRRAAGTRIGATTDGGRGDRLPLRRGRIRLELDGVDAGAPGRPRCPTAGPSRSRRCP